MNNRCWGSIPAPYSDTAYLHKSTFQHGSLHKGPNLLPISIIYGKQKNELNVKGIHSVATNMLRYEYYLKCKLEINAM